MTAMNPIDIDFAWQPCAAGRVLGVICLIASVLGLGATVWSYARLASAAGQLQQQLRQHQAPLQASQVPAVAPAGREAAGRDDALDNAYNSQAARERFEPEFKRAVQIIGQLDTPWDPLFRAVEVAAVDQVTLLGLDPDPEQGTVRITGEAAHHGAALDYVRRLGRAPGLVRVHLSGHQIKLQDPQHPFGFTVQATWVGVARGTPRTDRPKAGPLPELQRTGPRPAPAALPTLQIRDAAAP